VGQEGAHRSWAFSGGGPPAFLVYPVCLTITQEGGPARAPAVALDVSSGSTPLTSCGKVSLP